MILLDTNVLLRRTNPVAPENVAVEKIMRSLTASGETCGVCAQNLVELWAVLTRPVAANGIGLTPDHARERIDTIRAALHLLQDPPDLLDTWLNLCTTHAVRGRQVYDARLVALMIASDVKKLVTLNPADFSRFTMIDVIVP